MKNLTAAILEAAPAHLTEGKHPSTVKAGAALIAAAMEEAVAAAVEAGTFDLDAIEADAKRIAERKLAEQRRFIEENRAELVSYISRRVYDEINAK